MLPRFQLPLAALTILIISSFFCDVSLAQNASRKFKAGDECLFHFLGEWRSGKVTATEKDQVEFEYEFAGKQKLDVRNRDDLRFPWEMKAISKVRFWKDESGKFRVQAALVGLKLDQGEIVLHKIEDDTEITVQIAKLSEADRTFLKKLETTAGPMMPELPELTQFATGGDDHGRKWNDAPNLLAVSPDPPTMIPELPMAGAVFPKIDFFESVNRLIAIGGADGWMAAGTSSSMDKAPGRLLWVSLKDKSVRTLNALPLGEKVAAADAASAQMLTISEGNGKKACLTLWNADPQKKTAEARVRWESNGDRFPNSDMWAEIVSANLVFHRWSRHQYVMWNVAEQKEVYRIDQESFFVAEPQFSPGKRYLALPEDSRVRVIDVETGDTVAVLPIKGSSRGVAFDPYGLKLAVLTSEQVLVWTLGTSDEPFECRSDGLGSAFGSAVDWVDPQTLLVGHTVLFDLKLGIPVWSYRLAHWNVQDDHRGDRSMSVANGKLCYVATAESGGDDVYVVGAVDLPGPKVRESVAQVDPSQLYILGPGSGIKLDVQCGEHDNVVSGNLEELVKKKGWRVDQNSSNVLVARMGQSETQSATYVNRSTGAEVNVSITPFYSSLQVVCDGEIAWSNGTSSGGMPSIIFETDGQSIQSRIDASQRPYPEFFANQQVPEKVFDPKYKNGFGTSEVGLRGLVPIEIRLPSGVESVPPGG